MDTNVIVVDGSTYSQSRSGIASAIAALPSAGGEVVIPGGATPEATRLEYATCPYPDATPRHYVTYSSLSELSQILAEGLPEETP